MNDRTGLKFLRFVFVIITLFLCLTAAALAGEGRVSITARAPAVGAPLETELSGPEASAVEYRWTVAGEEAGAGPSYTPGAADHEAWIEVRVLDRATGEPLAADKIYFSPLPVVYIDTEDARPVIDRDEYISASMRVQGSYEYDGQYDGGVAIKGRGSSSWHYDKKPYKLKLDKKSDLFGFGKSKHYVLLANYLDPSLLRNTVAYRLSAKMGLIATDTVWVDVVMNGEYVGNYQLCEHVRVGPQLVDVADWEAVAGDAAEALSDAFPERFPDASALEDAMSEDLSWLTSGVVSFEGQSCDLRECFDMPDDLSGGFLFELGFDYEKDVTHFATENGIRVIVSKPEYLYTNAELTDYVRDYFQSLEDALCSPDGYDGLGRHYSELADVDSLVAYWLTMEILSNEDAAGRSRFCWKEAGGKLVFGPVWDFDIGGGSFRSFFGPTGWSVTDTVSGRLTKQDFWKELIDDPYFQIKAQEKYREIRPFLERLTADGGIIDSYSEYLYEAGAANELLWSGDGYMTRTFSGERGDVAVYKEFLSKRLDWLDSIFDTEDSAARGLRLASSANPYVRNAWLRFSVENGSPDAAEHGSEFVIPAGEDLRLSVRSVACDDARLYVNGALCGVFSYDELAAGIVVPASRLNGEGAKNVVSLIAVSDGTTYTNYTTVKAGERAATSDADDAGDPCALAGHSLSPVAPRAAAERRYGLRECWYCASCHSYFADCDGSARMKASEAVIPFESCRTPGGIVESIKGLALRAVSSLITGR